MAKANVRVEAVERPTAAFETVPLDSLSPDAGNVRLHPERNRASLAASLRQFGPARSIVVDGKGVIRAGNGTVEAAREAGITEVLIVDPGPGQMVAVRRKDWSATEATAYGVADNRTAELAEWDDSGLAETLRALQSEDFDLSAVGYDPGEVDALIEGMAAQAAGGLGDGYDAEGDPDDDDIDGDPGGEEDDDTPAEPLVFSHEQVIESAFAWFRKTGFPYRNLPLHVCMQELNRLASTAPDRLLGTKTGYYVADTYHPHRLSASADGMSSPVTSFADDGLLRRAIRLKLASGRNVGDDCLDTIPVVSGTQACSNFRPGFACKLYREYCRPGATVLDTSTGYGGRLVGFMASGVAGKYIGIDPNVPTHEGNTRMAADLGFAGRVELHNLPAEDVPQETVAGRCDFAFTSPPYFCKEHYSDDPTQSWVRYRTGEAWRDGFLLPMLRLQFAALKPGAFSLVNIADVKVKNRTYPLAAWTVAMGESAGFQHVRTDEFPLQKRFGAGQDDAVATEPVIVLQRPR